MADYINIHGNNIPIRASDPSNPIIGEIWYNSTSSLLKGRIFESDSFSSIAARSTTTRGSGQTGTVTAGLVTAGFTGSFPIIRTTEEWNGSAWSGAPDTGSDHYVASMSGIQTAAIVAGGYKTTPHSGGMNAQTEEYDGSNWTTSPNINTARYGMGNVGGTSAAVIFGGEEPSGTNTNVTEDWNGSGWTSSNNMNTAANYKGSVGNTTTAAYALGGYLGPPGRTANVEKYDGTCWTAVNSLNVAVNSQAAWGTPTSGLSVGGNRGNPAPAASDVAESWDGTCFTVSAATLSTARANAWNGFGSSGSDGIVAGGYNGTANTNVCEEFTGAAASTKTISSS
jgi:hypothetical protein